MRPRFDFLRLGFGLLLLAGWTCWAQAPRPYLERPEVQALIQELVVEAHLPEVFLRRAFLRARYSAKVADLMAPAPPGTKNWRTYRDNVLAPLRVREGVRFWRRHARILARAQRDYGVPPEITVAILGVETRYGRAQGRFPVLDVLATLAFDFPESPVREARSALFRAQLKDYLIWCRQTRTDPGAVRGSYAGAIGIPQFLPGSIRAHAVDFDRNGRIDLRHSAADAIGSVGRFLQAHGWERDRPVLWRPLPESIPLLKLKADGVPEPRMRLGDLAKAGLKAKDLESGREADTPVLVVDLPSSDGSVEYAVGLRNFYVLTRYNRSFFYAMGVFELAEAVRKARAG